MTVACIKQYVESRNSTYPYDEPSAACTKMEKKTRTIIDVAKVWEYAKMTTSIPSTANTNDCHNSLPRKPISFIMDIEHYR